MILKVRKFVIYSLVTVVEEATQLTGMEPITKGQNYLKVFIFAR